jgi:hypothetical protein
MALFRGETHPVRFTASSVDDPPLPLIIVTGPRLLTYTKTIRERLCARNEQRKIRQTSNELEHDTAQGPYVHGTRLSALLAFDHLD